MSAATIDKPATRGRKATVPQTLLEATVLAMAEVQKALGLIDGARKAAVAGDYEERTLRIAEDMAADVYGWMDNSERDANDWSDRLYDSQSLLMCVDGNRETEASALAAKKAGEHLGKAADLLDGPFPDKPARPAAVVIDAGAPGGPVHVASLARHVIETLRHHTKHAALAALDDQAFEAVELLHVAISKQDKDGGNYAASKIEQVLALAWIMEHHDDSGAWDSLGAAQHLLREALERLNEMRGTWQ